MLTPVARLELKNMVQRVLHVPGNYMGGPLEMTVVFDTALPQREAADFGKELVAVLKSMGDVFRNVRLNVVFWDEEGQIRHEISAFAHLQTGNALKHYGIPGKDKTLEELCGELKMYQARSRLVFLISDGNFISRDPEKLRENLNPFLYRRLIVVTPDGLRPGISLLPA